MLKTLEGTKSKTRPGEGGVEIGNSKAGHEGSKLDESKLHGDEVDGGEIDGGEIEDDKVGEKVQTRSKSKNLSKSKKMVRSLDFFYPQS